jgi:hypothetical protein
MINKVVLYKNHPIMHDVSSVSLITWKSQQWGSFFLTLVIEECVRGAREPFRSGLQGFFGISK